MRISTAKTARLCLTLSFLVSLASCESADVIGPRQVSGGRGSALVSTTAVSQSVSGNVTIAVQPVPDQVGVVFDYSFSATQKLEALALTPSFIQGQFHFNYTVANTKVVVDGDVACFFIVANKARVAGVIGRTSEPLLFPVGSTMIWSVTDNGGIQLPATLPVAAPTSTPDMASPLLRLPGVDPLTYCLAGGFAPELPVLRGQVQIKAQ